MPETKEILRNPEENYKIIAERYKVNLTFYHQLIALMHDIEYDVMNKFAARGHSSGQKRTGSLSVVDICEARSLHSFVGHYTLLQAGVVVDSYGSLRTIYENILRAYIVHCLDDVGETAYHYYLGLNDEKAERFKREFQRLPHRVLLQKLYDGPLAASCKSFYEVISGKVHTSIKGMAGLFEIREQDYIDSLKMGIGLAYANTVLMFELYGDDIGNSFTKILLDLLPQHDKFIPEGIPNLIPNSKACLEKLKIKEFAEFVQKLHPSL